jgi:hypothetical protein
MRNQSKKLKELKLKNNRHTPKTWMFILHSQFYVFKINVNLMNEKFSIINFHLIQRNFKIKKRKF